jgi:acyl carrier protein
VELQRLVGAALGMGVVDVPDPAQPLSELGFDSLMAVELKTQVETRLGAVLPAAIFLEGPSIVVLAEHVTERLAATAATTQSPTPTPTESGGGRDTVSSLTGLDQLSDDEVNTMLYSLLAERGPEQ